MEVMGDPYLLTDEKLQIIVTILNPSVDGIFAIFISSLHPNIVMNVPVYGKILQKVVKSSPLI